MVWPSRANPYDPQAAVPRRVGVTLFVRVLVMHTMGRDPKNRTTLQSQRTAHRQKIFHPLRSFIASMRKQPMVPHTDTKAAGNPTQRYREQKCLPTEHE